MYRIPYIFLLKFLIFSQLRSTYCSDITDKVFKTLTDGLPAAFGDFNSDELTDIFVIRNDSRTVEIFLSAEEEPLLTTSEKHPLKCMFEHGHKITSVVPGDFDGDALMDVLVTTVNAMEINETERTLTNVYIMWGGATHLNCSYNRVLKLYGQPLAIDYNQDMIIDLFGRDEHRNRMFWVFNKTRTYHKIPMLTPDLKEFADIKQPHAHAFLDLNEDNFADLFITTQKNFEVWHGSKRGFTFNHTIEHPKHAKEIGQSLYIDVELRGRMALVTPVCYDDDCKNSSLLVYSEGKWHNLHVNFKDNENNIWRFHPVPGTKYTDTITLRSGDFNLDGYPDILATLTVDGKSSQSFLLENVKCEVNCDEFARSFEVKWGALRPFTNGTVMAAFFDFYQDGVLDVILVRHNGTHHQSVAFKNSLDYDANFIKVMVITGLKNDNIMGRISKKRRTYGTNLPGPRISYKTTTQEGDPRHAVSAQLPQSAHFSLNLPYNIFGLGRTPNFVDSLTVGLSGDCRTWTQIIPNSQMVVIPADKPSQWKAQLFVTPSKLILMSVAGLTTACCLITVIIGLLHWKEKQEDKKERLSETHRFHFDAM